MWKKGMLLHYTDVNRAQIKHRSKTGAMHWLHLERFQIFSKRVANFHQGVERHQADDVVKIIRHGPRGKVVKELFHNVDLLYFWTHEALLFHGGACVYQHLKKVIPINNNHIVNVSRLPQPVPHFYNRNNQTSDRQSFTRIASFGVRVVTNERSSLWSPVLCQMSKTFVLIVGTFRDSSSKYNYSFY